MNTLRYVCAIWAILPPLGTTLAEPTAEELIEDLRDDDVRWNAIHASTLILRMDAPPHRELYKALDSEDWQQRQLACGLIWTIRTWRVRPEDKELLANFPITGRLVDVSIEGLRNDELPRDADGNYNSVFNARNAFRGLPEVASEYREKFEAGLRSDDYQQKLMCALILSHGGVAESADLVAPILIPHLRHNDIPEDANLAAYGLYRLGPGVTPHLERAARTADGQQSELIALLLLNFADPPQDRRDLEKRKRLQRITKINFDPTVQRKGPSTAFLHAVSRSGLR